MYHRYQTLLVLPYCAFMAFLKQKKQILLSFQVTTISDVEVFQKEYPLLSAVNRAASCKDLFMHHLYIQADTDKSLLQCLSVCPYVCPFIFQSFLCSSACSLNTPVISTDFLLNSDIGQPLKLGSNKLQVFFCSLCFSFCFYLNKYKFLPMVEFLLFCGYGLLVGMCQIRNKYGKFLECPSSQSTNLRETDRNILKHIYSSNNFLQQSASIYKLKMDQKTNISMLILMDIYTYIIQHRKVRNISQNILCYESDCC